MAKDIEKTSIARSYVVVSIVAALALFGVTVLTVAVTIPIQQQQAEAAGCERGLPQSAFGFNASKGRCFGH